MRIGEEANFNVEITPQAPIGVVIGDCAKMDVQKAITYVESGKKEIEKAVEDGKADFDDHAADKTQDFDDNAVNKTNAFNQNAVNKTQDFNDNAAIKQASVDASAAEAKQWAIGDPTEPADGSSKYWANQASSTLSSLSSRVSTIEGEIPSAASSSNQLADKNFVNSSISTNTANFIGTFNSVAALEAYSGTLTNNDYAFVIDTDLDGNTVYNRYKYTTATTPASWVFEYALNNSSFTAVQWEAINSGATTANISSIASKADDNAVVHLAGAETISGSKTFTSTNKFQAEQAFQNMSVTKGTAPSSAKYTSITFCDKNGTGFSANQLGNIQHVSGTDGSSGVQISAIKSSSGSTSSAKIGVYYPSSGSAYTYAPTPSVSSNDTNIATTAYINNKFKVVASLPATPDANTFYFIEES